MIVDYEGRAVLVDPDPFLKKGRNVYRPASIDRPRVRFRALRMLENRSSLNNADSPELNTMLGQLGLLPLFSQPPAWAEH